MQTFFTLAVMSIIAKKSKVIYDVALDNAFIFRLKSSDWSTNDGVTRQ